MKKCPRSPAAARRGIPDPVPGDAGVAHPEPTRLVDLADGRLTAADARSVRSHLRTCPPCAALASAFVELVGTLKAERADAPPSALRAWARALPDALARPRARGALAGLGHADAPGRRSPGQLGRAVASARAGLLRLVADSWGLLRELTTLPEPGPALLGGVRSAGPGAISLGRRRLLFSARPFDLDIEVDYSGEADPRRLHGQILPGEGSRRLWQGAEVRLTDTGRVVARARVDRRGEFRLSRIPPGRYRIEVTGPADASACASPFIQV